MKSVVIDIKSKSSELIILNIVKRYLVNWKMDLKFYNVAQQAKSKGKKIKIHIGQIQKAKKYIHTYKIIIARVR